MILISVKILCVLKKVYQSSKFDINNKDHGKNDKKKNIIKICVYINSKK